MSPARAGSAPRLGSLCTGYGGLDLAAKAVFGARPVWFADNDPDAVRVLKHHHRRVPNLGDITGLDFADHDAVPGVDILTAGWPCQDISIAGRGEGLKKGNRSGLWFTVAAAVRDLRLDLGCSWKMWLSSGDAASTVSKPTWPAAGTTRNGSAFERPRWEPHTDEPAASSSPDG